MNLYKYASQENIEHIFCEPGKISFRCSYPKDFNDPYELFLTINFQQEPKLLAFYEDVIGKIPQEPTTCFSTSPAVIPMWAHYANNHKGFAIEVDEIKLASLYPESGFGNIDYQEKPSEHIQELFERAFYIGKPRYVNFLHNAVFSAAYYTKSSCWSYEMERRMILQKKSVRSHGEILLLDIPDECVTSIIVGARADSETKEALKSHAKKIKCHIYEMKIGRSSLAPFFITKNGRTSTFNGKEFEIRKRYCSSCGEPVQKNTTMCSWCSINDSHRIQAASRNPYRILANAGLLDSYIESMNRISQRSRS